MKCLNKSNPEIKALIDHFKSETIVAAAVDYYSFDESKITYTDEEGNPCAAAGLKGKFTTGGTWEVIKEFKGASHAKGGIDIEIGGGAIKMTGKEGKIEAKHGLVISKEELIYE